MNRTLIIPAVVCVLILAGFVPAHAETQVHFDFPHANCQIEVVGPPTILEGGEVNLTVLYAPLGGGACDMTGFYGGIGHADGVAYFLGVDDADEAQTTVQWSLPRGRLANAYGLTVELDKVRILLGITDDVQAGDEVIVTWHFDADEPFHVMKLRVTEHNYMLFLPSAIGS